MKKAFLIALALLTVLCGLPVGGCALVETINGETSVSAEVPNPVVTIEMDDGGIIQLELYPQIAPNTTANFVNLAESGFYDGSIFHRVIPGFMIQGGGPDGSGISAPDYTIKGEFSSNGFANELKHTRGVISMARAKAPDSASTQFFIMHADADYLDGQYAAFGKVTSGLEVVDAIANINTDHNDKPLVMLGCTIRKVTVDTKGYQYATVKIEP